MLKNIDRTYKLIIIIVGIIGLIFSLYLTFSELLESGFCPKIGFIPACFLVTVAFILIIFSEFLQSFNSIFCFTIGWITGFLLGVWFSYNQIFGLDNCPLFLDIPMCYLSLGLFLILIILKISLRFYKMKIN